MRATLFRARGTRPTHVVLGVVIALALASCADAPTTSGPAPAALASFATQSPAPRFSCPEVAFDPAASLAPAFQAELFVPGESEVVTGRFVAALARLYAAGSDIDPCRWFTGHGLRTALVADGRLREVAQGELKIEGDLFLRAAFEGPYDLRSRPPVLPIDAVFDLGAGATITDPLTSARTITTADERIALHIDFLFDGHQWRADRVAAISAENARWARLPASLAPGPPCTGFARDPVGAPFDETAGAGLPTPSDDSGPAGRTWCDADGRGRTIRQPEQLALLTRYPCGAGHAAVLTLGQPLGAAIDPLVRHEYVRDPEGEFLAQGWMTAPYQANATLPAGAAYTGWTNGNVEVWVNPDELAEAIYVKRGDLVERWPRPAKDWGVIDCN